MTKKTLSLFIIIITYINSFAQEKVNPPHKFGIDFVVNGGIGYAEIENDNEPNYNLNVNTTQLLIDLKIWKDYGIATGARYNKLTGNGYNSKGHFYQTKTLIQIPILLSLRKEIAKNIHFKAYIGPYMQTAAEDSFRYLNSIDEDVYSKWTVGMDLGIGISYKISEILNFGFYISGQQDFNKIESDNTALIRDKQKIKTLNTFGIIAHFEL